ncbi:hypothetical protein OC845_004417 [Tilletia horrida]|nr:hypothetical protein OC845_004417 [Tilletia horrida]
MQDALSRIPVAPPLIAQLRTFDKEGVEITAGEDLPYLTCTVSLLTEHGGDANLVMASPVPSASTPEREPSNAKGKKRASGRKSSGRHGTGRGADSRGASNQHPADAEAEASGQRGPGLSPSTASVPTRTLAGDRPAQGELYLDLDDQRRLFFIFPEVCVRLPGRFRLQIHLSRIPSSNGSDSPFANSMLTGAITDVITVVDRENFVAPGPTRLMRRLAEQGVVFTTSGIANDT